ncbi:unnamed protein product [Plutella xylostella]|uniref:(diamondback moth) hypothetical protein n=1 Tax=Plutella xylostella TaxID=51655 RepID=A0A8S4ELI5_PLUXY|nr:unnamed protein product [Plutella xylostella]
MNFVFSLTETVASLVFHPFYSWTYMKTLAALPGAVFLISAALVVPACTVASLVFHPFYSWTYMKTLAALPGAVFLISAALVVPACVILVIFYVQHKLESRNARKKALEAEEKRSNNEKEKGEKNS